MSKAERMRLCETIWLRIKTRHWDERKVGANWDAVKRRYRPLSEASQSDGAFYALMQRMVGELGQSHFYVIPTITDPESTVASTPAGNAWHGMQIRLVEGEPVVTEVEPSSPAELAGVKRGWVIDQLGDIDVRKGLEQIVKDKGRVGATQVAYASKASRITRGPVDTPYRYLFRDSDNRAHEVMITGVETPGVTSSFGNLKDIPTTFKVTMTDDNVCIIRFNIWLINPLMTQIREAVLENASARGFVIDLRGNPGGVGVMASGLAGLFMPKYKKSLSLGSMNMRRNTLQFAINPQPPYYTGPVSILIDEMSLSTSEVFAGGMQSLGRAIVVGRTTGGMVLPSNIEQLSDSLKFQYAIADFVTPSGVLLEARGVKPDVPVRLTRQSLTAAGDPMLAAAIGALAKARRW